MRKLLWFTLGFVPGVAAVAYLPVGSWVLPVAAVCFAFFLSLIAYKAKDMRVAALFLLGVAVSLTWSWGFDRWKLSDLRPYDGTTVQTTVIASDYSYETQAGVGADGHIQLDGKTYRVRFYMEGKTPIQPGDKVTGSCYLRYTSIGGLEKETSHQGKGIFILAYLDEDAQVEKGAEPSARFFPAHLRQSIKNRIDSIFPEDTFAFARALLLGDSSALSNEEDSNYQTSGIRHIIAVSGLHISILFSAICLMVQNRKYLVALLGIPLLLLFSALAGFTPSVVRACVMQLVLIISLLVNKEYDPPSALAAAVLVILGINPMAVTSISFQLSVGCMAGIFAFSGRISGYLLHPNRLGPGKGRGLVPRITRWFVGSISVSLSAMVFTVPLCAIYFGSVSIVSALTNLLCLWIIPIVFVGIILAVSVSALWTAGGVYIAWAVSWAIRYVQTIARWISQIPYASVYSHSIYIILWLVLCYVLFGFMMLSKKKKPLFVMGCMAAGLAICLLFMRLEPKLDGGRMTVLDVGQGQCLILETEDRVYMVDCGGDFDDRTADTAFRRLRSYGIRRLDGLILTHFDYDHVGGAHLLMERVSVDRVYVPDFSDEKGIRKTLEQVAGARLYTVTEAVTLEGEDYSLSVIPAEAPRSENESSLCILFQGENCDILITGDRNTTGEKALLAQADIPDIEVLVAGHHGSESSTGMEFLYETQPEYVVISVGADNNYGHPDPNLLERLRIFGCQVLRTDEKGTIVLRW